MGSETTTNGKWAYFTMMIMTMLLAVISLCFVLQTNETEKLKTKLAQYEDAALVCSNLMPAQEAEWTEMHHVDPNNDLHLLRIGCRYNPEGK